MLTTRKYKYVRKLISILTLLHSRGCCFYPTFLFLNFSKMVASIKSKFSIHVKLIQYHLINIDMKILTQNLDFKIRKKTVFSPDYY